MQARTLKYFMAACGVAAAVACADDRPATNPTMPITRVSALVIPAGCDFTVMKQDAKGYFLAGNDSVYAFIQTWSGSNKTKPDTTFKRQGFDVLAYVGRVAGNSAVVSADSVAGDAFVRDVVTCLGFVMPAGTFTGALGLNGMFAVPAGSAAVTSRGTPLYGVEPTAPWDSSSGQAQFLLYGAPRNYSFSNEQAALDTAGGAYDLNTIPPHLTFSPPIHGGTCTEVDDPNTVLQHENEILQAVALNFCPTGVSSSRGTERGVFALARRLSNWFTPRPAYAAATLVAVKPPGGALGGLSPIGPVVVNAATVKIAFVVEPSNGTINKDIKPPIVVSAKTANNTALDGVSIKLNVFNNQGAPIKFSGDSAVTTAGGLATFEHFQTNKAGGYTIVATGTIFGSATKADTSALFNVQGKK